VVTLLGATEIRALAERLGVSPTKKWGQNFVHDANTVRKIVTAAKLQAGEAVVEVGPGLGSLTLGLLEQGHPVTAIEIDPRLAAELPATAEEHGVTAGMLTDSQASRLAEAGLSAYNHNLDTSPEHYGEIITTSSRIPLQIHYLSSRSVK
jgi:16S rRNA (adenine1518-N6/adenine1519-N6)-dimethyltransferase